jgi:hypothetical protein
VPQPALAAEALPTVMRKVASHAANGRPVETLPMPGKAG